MSYFENFGKVLYTFANENVVTTNISAYAEVLDDIRVSSEFYQDYYIQSGERADQTSYSIYGDPSLHWTFYLMNPKLREQGWPLSSSELTQKVKKDYPNYVLVSNSDLANNLKGGQIIRGETSGVDSTVLHINYDLGQITIDKKLENTPESLRDMQTDSALNVTYVSQSEEHLAAHHYTIGGVITDINPFVDIPLSAIKVTNQEFYVSNNDNLKQIRIIKPNVINQVTNAFYDAIREI